MSDANEKIAIQSENFWKAFLISLAAWILDAELALFFLGWFLFDKNRGTWTIWGQITRQLGSPMTIPFVIVLGFVWLPVAIIAGQRARKRGLKAALQLVLWAFIVAPIIVGCLFSYIIGMAG